MLFDACKALRKSKSPKDFAVDTPSFTLKHKKEKPQQVLVSFISLRLNTEAKFCIKSCSETLTKFFQNQP